ncbi:hypothetical protein R3W88_029985 [Solanum pinnatisectum]|uniref:Response regulatory domain-containing protein n=1 Tax=Solanum pinnatisectum TaxID=50273 RepID=A0AAV9K6W3_9SOLN|nr:hypothetical protein R3W88_029985 [Solanum pinnatisectum]
MDCEIIHNVDVPSAYVGLRILLVDPDTTSLSNIAAILEEHSFKGTIILCLICVGAFPPNFCWIF